MRSSRTAIRVVSRNFLYEELNMIRSRANGRGTHPKGGDFLHSIERALNKRVTLQLDGKSVRMTLEDAAALKLVTDAARGVASAQRELFRILSAADAERKADERSPFERAVDVATGGVFSRE